MLTAFFHWRAKQPLTTRLLISAMVGFIIGSIITAVSKFL